ncbi:MAG: NADP-dependent oxidoreductase [Gammaproteobacteria bacterium]|nr:NADP-dependent oxidoreductase [Gammaproteobacteria bacterium]
MMPVPVHQRADMSEFVNRKWVVASRPEVEVELSNFELQEEPVADLEPGQLLLKSRYVGVNPPMRMALVSGGIAGRPIPIGRTMYGGGLAEVAASEHPKFAVGDLVQGELGWQEYAISDGARRHAVNKVEAPAGLSETTLMHVMGGSGATAYFGMIEYCKPRPGDTLVVSTAAGTVGALVCQLGRLQGCRVVGIAGSEDKCNYVTSELGAEACINYKSEDVAERLRETCPDGINIYFDNVGGETLDAVLGQIAFGARVVLCGGTSQYNNDLDWYGPKNYFNLVYQQAEMYGYFIGNFSHRYHESRARIGALLREGRMTYREDVLEGIENLPTQLIRILRGENFGIPMVRIS